MKTDAFWNIQTHAAHSICKCQRGQCASGEMDCENALSRLIFSKYKNWPPVTKDVKISTNRPPPPPPHTQWRAEVSISNQTVAWLTLQAKNVVNVSNVPLVYRLATHSGSKRAFSTHLHLIYMSNLNFQFKCNSFMWKVGLFDLKFFKKNLDNVFSTLDSLSSVNVMWLSQFTHFISNFNWIQRVKEVVGVP